MTSKEKKDNILLETFDNFQINPDMDNEVLVNYLGYFEENFKWKDYQPSNELFFNFSNVKTRNVAVDHPISGYEMSPNELYIRLLSEIKKQHKKTRSVIKDETSNLRRELITCIKHNPIDAVDFFSKILLIFSCFTLGVWSIIGYSIMNPLFSILLILSSGTGIVMAKIRRSKIH